MLPYMGTAIKHPAPDRVKPSFVIFDTGHSGAQLKIKGLTPHPFKGDSLELLKHGSVLDN